MRMMGVDSEVGGEEEVEEDSEVHRVVRWMRIVR